MRLFLAVDCNSTQENGVWMVHRFDYSKCRGEQKHLGKYQPRPQCPPARRFFCFFVTEGEGGEHQSSSAISSSFDMVRMLSSEPSETASISSAFFCWRSRIFSSMESFTMSLYTWTLSR